MNRRQLLVTAAGALAAAAAVPATMFVAGASDDPASAQRDALYGEVPLGAYAAKGKAAYPWTSLRAAATAIAAGDHTHATSLLHRVATDPHVEPLMRLEAWTALRGLGAFPTPSEAARFEGVVVEVILSTGRDTLAAYADKSAVYISASGQTITLLPGTALGPQVDAVLAAGRVSQRRIGPWMSAQTPALPYNGGARVTILTAWGISFGQGPIDSISRDPRSSQVFNAANTLLQAMIARANAPEPTGKG
ncbi:MAG: hypothetical protein ABSH03_07045 [Candidatus Lustribacter sp.]|jgi:hypothetical protein